MIDDATGFGPQLHTAGASLKLIVSCNPDTRDRSISDLCENFQHLHVRPRRPRKASPVIDATLNIDILQTLHIAWQGDFTRWVPRGVLNQTLTRTDGLLERVERSRQGLKLRKTRAREPHKRLQFLIERE